jgi:hypothetical protein
MEVNGVYRRFMGASVIASSHVPLRSTRFFTLAVFLVSVGFVFETSRAEEKSPQAILMVQRGLDVQNNKIDALIAQSGVACLPAVMSRPCPIEEHLLSFLRSLPADKEAIVKNLQGLGALCHLQQEKLSCKIERETEITGYTSDPEIKPNTIIDHFFIEFIVTGQGPALQYQVNFDRISKLKEPQN